MKVLSAAIFKTTLSALLCLPFVAAAKPATFLALNYGTATLRTSAPETDLACARSLYTQTLTTYYSTHFPRGSLVLGAIQRTHSSYRIDFNYHDPANADESYLAHSENEIDFRTVGDVRYCNWTYNFEINRDTPYDAQTKISISSNENIQADDLPREYIESSEDGPLTCAAHLVGRFVRTHLRGHAEIASVELGVAQNKADARSNNEKSTFWRGGSSTDHYRVMGTLTAFGKKRNLFGDASITYKNNFSSGGSHPLTQCYFNRDENLFPLAVSVMPIGARFQGDLKTLLALQTKYHNTEEKEDDSGEGFTDNRPRPNIFK